MRTATSKAGYGASHPMHARKIEKTIGTPVNKARCVGSDREWQTVATHLAGDSEIAAGIAPFRAVRRNSAPAGTKLREKMSELVA